MNNKILLTAALVVGSFSANAQQSRPTFAITGDGNNDFQWMNIRQVDLNTGQITKTLFERNNTAFTITDINNKTTLDQRSIVSNNFYSTPEYPTGTFVAAAAYDQRTNKLFFTPMRNASLRWMDLNNGETPKFYTLPIPGVNYDPADEAVNITRMVIGADGMGYAMSNDGNHFFSFTTGRKPVITELGNIIDAESNKGISIHNKCTSWGGDMIADAYGKLYVISASHNVFVIDINTRIATHMGNIQGLPGAYTTNAAAVNDNGEVVVASANMFDGYYTFKMSDLKAVKMEGSDVKYNASDFANSNLLFQKEAASMTNTTPLPTMTASADTKVFPNPVMGSSFNVLFDNQKEGRYTVVLSDLTGRTMLAKTVSITKGTQIEKINLNGHMSKGVYFVKVLDAAKTVVINEKIVMQ